MYHDNGEHHDASNVGGRGLWLQPAASGIRYSEEHGLCVCWIGRDADPGRPAPLRSLEGNMRMHSVVPVLRLWRQRTLAPAFPAATTFRVGRKGAGQLSGQRLSQAWVLALRAACVLFAIGATLFEEQPIRADEELYADDEFYTSELSRPFDGSRFKNLSERELNLVREYAQAWPRLGMYYDKILATGTYRSEHRVTGADSLSVAQTFEGTVRICGFHHFRVEGTSPDGEQGLILVTPREIHVFGINRDTGQHFLATKMSVNSRYATPYNSRYRLHKDPYICWELSSLMKGRDPGPEIESIRIDRVETAQEGSDELVTITVVCGGTGWCRIVANEFYRNRAWARRSGQHVLAELEKKRYIIERVRCEYNGDRDGFPILRESVNETATASFSANLDLDRCRFVDYDEEEVTAREVMTFEKLEHIVPEPGDFDPAPFLARIGGVGNGVSQGRGSVRLPLVIALNATVLVLLIAILWRRPRSNRRSGSDVSEK